MSTKHPNKFIVEATSNRNVKIKYVSQQASPKRYGNGNLETVTCKKCIMTFKNATFLKAHNEKFPNCNKSMIDRRCKQCCTIFKNRDFLLIHQRNFPNCDKKKPISIKDNLRETWCPHCSKDFDTKLKLKLHFQQVHNDDAGILY